MNSKTIDLKLNATRQMHSNEIPLTMRGNTEVIYRSVDWIDIFDTIENVAQEFYRVFTKSISLDIDLIELPIMWKKMSIMRTIWKMYVCLMIPNEIIQLTQQKRNLLVEVHLLDVILYNQQKHISNFWCSYDTEKIA